MRSVPAIVGHRRCGAASRAVLVVLAALAAVLIALALLMRTANRDTEIVRPGGSPTAPRAGETELEAARASKSELTASAGGSERLSAGTTGVRLRGPAKLDGRVIDRASGAGVGGVRVELLPVPPAGAAFLGRMLRIAALGNEFSNRVEPVASVNSDSTGAFRFEGVRQGTYYIDARGEYCVAESVVRARLVASGDGGPLDVYVNAGGRVLGRVLKPDGTPAASASLALVAGPNNFLANARTGDLRWLEQESDEKGRFVFGGVAPGAGYEITVSGKGFALSHALDIEVRAGQDTEVIVQTRIGGSVVGRVLSNVEGADPTPLAGAHLGAIPRGLRNLRCVEEILETTHCQTGADGAYLMQNVPPGDVDIVAIAWEHLPAVGARASLADTSRIQANDIVLSKGPLVRGRVLDTDGRPIHGVQARWNLIDWKNFQFDFSFAPLMMQAVKGFELPTTDADGRFFAGPIAGKPDYSIDFLKTGYVDQEFKWNPERDGPEITVTMRRGSAVEGIVMDAVKSEPLTAFTISGADRVDTEADAPGARNPFSGGQLVENPGGRFRVDSVKPGKASLTFSAPGYLEKTVTDINVVEGEPTRGVIVNLTPGGIVRGRVVDEKSEPVPGAQVMAASTNRKSFDPQAMRERGRDRRNRGGGFNMILGSSGGPDMLPPGMIEYAASMGLAGDKLVRADQKGDFVITGVETGSFRVLAFDRNHTSGRSEPQVMSAGGTLEGVIVTLPKGGAIRGTVRDRHGVPVPNELVLAFAPSSFDPTSPSTGGGLYQGQSDASGAYSIEHVAGGSYFLVATRGDEDLNPMSFFGTLNFDLVTVPAGEVVTYDLIDSSAGACKVYGTVLYRGEPVGKGNLSALSFDTDNLLGVEFKAAKMMDGGRFEFAGLAPGEYQLNFDGNGPQVRMSLDVPDLPEMRIDLRLPEAGVEGVVVDEASNKPLEGAEVVLRSTDAIESSGILGQFLSREGRSMRDNTNAKGEFSFERLAEGEYELLVRGVRRGDAKGKFAPSTALRVRVDGNRVESGIVVRLQSALSLQGRVVDSTKAPVKNATVLLTVQEGASDNIERAKTNDNGEFEITGLSPGTFRATATADGFADGTTGDIKLERGQGKQPTCEVVLQKGVKVYVTVYSANGTPASGARADLFPAQGERTNDPANAGKAIQNLFTGEGASGTDGRIELGRYMPGEYRLEVRRSFSKATKPNVVLKPGEDEVEIKIDLP
ncbi:MAG: carboxypeptidase regulatory-like domain-containing protein [Planctomycetes bacterium]|nr:carboxypeptidase regulatory-like domain-containing protein [Planctomycetota bacterium]